MTGVIQTHFRQTFLAINGFFGNHNEGLTCKIQGPLLCTRCEPYIFLIIFTELLSANSVHKKKKVETVKIQLRLQKVKKKFKLQKQSSGQNNMKKKKKGKKKKKKKKKKKEEKKRKKK